MRCVIGTSTNSSNEMTISVSNELVSPFCSPIQYSLYKAYISEISLYQWENNYVIRQKNRGVFAYKIIKGFSLFFFFSFLWGLCNLILITISTCTLQEVFILRESRELWELYATADIHVPIITVPLKIHISIKVHICAKLVKIGKMVSLNCNSLWKVESKYVK